MDFLCGTTSYLSDSEESYPPLAFDGNIEAPVYLIEVGSGSSRRVDVTPKLIEEYIEKDFGVIDINCREIYGHNVDNHMQRLSTRNSVQQALSRPDHEAIKLL
jgi:hypothetical protein